MSETDEPKERKAKARSSKNACERFTQALRELVQSPTLNEEQVALLLSRKTLPGELDRRDCAAKVALKTMREKSARAASATRPGW